MHAVDGLHVRVDVRAYAVPQRTATQLFALFHDGLSTDPAADLLELERAQRVRVCAREIEIRHAERAVAAARTAVLDARGRRRRRERAALRTAVIAHRRAARAFERARLDNRVLRRFIMGLPVVSGDLNAARRGWLTGTARPGLADIFFSEQDFLAADPRRAVTTGWGGTAIGGFEYGQQWRRDGDDDPDVPDPAFSGPWTVAFIEQTRELYAHRRWCTHLPEEIWLLATGIGPSILPRLRQLQRLMRDPNSLMLVVRAVEHHAHFDPEFGPTTHPRARGTPGGAAC
ncbi:hypothetical protein [Amycolatopsis anabasis]|uniref:hypothetical protein n=1 Tax=Amycolatopsis anabasis TaxID=1840409 RepID=UPI00131BF2CF|nr:hypothetical protein [Amycolatopsis anabasis]